eukprot:608861-Amphidinium_carterae.1
MGGLPPPTAATASAARGIDAASATRGTDADPAQAGAAQEAGGAAGSTDQPMASGPEDLPEEGEQDVEGAELRPERVREADRGSGTC